MVNSMNNSDNNNGTNTNSFKFDDLTIVPVNDRDPMDIPTHVIVSKLFNYMKISEMDKYGIDVFRHTFTKCMKFLNETDFQSLISSYWCNDHHFDCMISRRGTEIRDGTILQLKISDELLDNAMQGGASVEKISSMLKQRRNDIDNKRQSLKQERRFFIRNCRLRFWNHEVLVQAYIKNGWLNKQLAQIGIDNFISHIYSRAVNPNKFNNVSFSSHFLHSFFVSQYSLDDIPAVYASQLRYTQEQMSNSGNLESNISAKLLTRWCQLVELLTSRGAKVRANAFKILPLTYAAQLGTNTYSIIRTPINKKNQIIEHTLDLVLPSDIWICVTDYL